MKNTLSLLLFIIFCLNLSVSHAKPEITEPLTKVTLQLMWKHQFEFAGFYAAIEQGYYKEVGLDVDVREYQKDTELVKEVISGRTQYGISDSSIIIHRAHGDPVVLLANVFQHSPMVLLSRSDAKIFSPAQMAGKSIMLSTHEQDNASIIAMLNAESVSLKQMDVKEHSFNIDDFINGKVDIISAYATNEPGILNERQVKFNIIDPINYGIDFYGNNIFSSEKHIQENPQQTADFIKASLKGWEYALTHRDEVIELILKKYSSHKSRTALKYEAKTLLERFILPVHISLGAIDQIRMERIVDTYKQLKMIPMGFTLKGFIYQQSDNLEHSLQLSKEEQLWVKQHPKIIIGVDPAWAPFEFINEQGQYSGMASDYINLIAEKTGLEFEVQNNPTWKDVMKSARSGGLDLLPAVMTSPQREEFLDFSKPHINYPMVIVTGKDNKFISSLDELNNKQVTVVSDYVTEDILRNNHPNIKLKPAKDLQQALKWVSSGEVDALVDNIASVTYTISKMGITNLRISGTTPYEFALSIAVPKQHKTLLAIIQKALDSISEKRQQKIRNQWISVTYEQGIDYNNLVKISLVVLAFILLILLWNWRLSSEIKARKVAEHALYENQKILEYKNHILELLSKGTNLKTILETLIQYLEASHPEMIGSILLLDKQKKHLINGVAISLPEHYIEAINGVEIGFSVGSCGTAAFTGEQVIVEDIMTHPYWEGFQELAQSAGLRACWSQPIMSSSNEVLGTFAIYYRQPKTPKESSLRLIHEFSILTALAIENFQSNETLKKLSLAVTQSANVVVITDCRGIIEYVNPKFAEITGYSSDEAIGNTPRLLKSGQTDKAVYIELWKTLLSGKKWQGEFLNRRKNGELYWAWDNIAPIENDAGEITHFVAVQIDFTERKQAQEALQESENRFRQLFEGANDSIFIIDPQTGQFIDANENASSRLGYTHDELLKLREHDIKISEDASHEDDNFQKLNKTGHLIFKNIHQHKDGSAIPVEISAKLIKHHNVTVIQSIVRDISERKEAERKLINSEAQFRSLVENTNIVAWKLNLESFRFTYVSPHAETMLGYPVEDWKRENFWEDHIVNEDRNYCVSYCMEATNKGEDHDFEYRMKKANGDSIWLRDIVTVNKDITGHPVSLSGFLIDIDERKKIEVALEKAKLEAEQANKVKSEFLATMTHELRTPMNGVLGMAQILEETELNPEQRESVNIILRSGHSLLEIINDVLDLSKLEAEQVILEQRYFNLEQLIDDILGMLRPKSSAKSLQLSVIYPVDYPRYFVGDPTRLQQVLLNLMSNAVKFTSSGYVRLIVLCNAVTEERAEVKLSIEDTGIGIATENIAHLFDPFVQADQTTTRKYGGSGLGLAVSKKLINLMQGNIGVNSVLGQGAEFWVTLSLPLADKKTVKNDPQTKVLNHIVFNRKILIVEDDAVNLKIAIKMLSKTGLIIDIAKNGQQAVDRWQQEDYDLILMDCRMPIMDGYEATKIIRQQESDSHVPIIALTANSSHEDRQRCLDSGMDEVITKPFKKEFLINSLNKWLRPVLQSHENKSIVVDNKMIEVLSVKNTIKEITLDKLLLEKLKKEMGEDFPEVYSAIVQTIGHVIQQLDDDLEQMSTEKITRLAHSLKSPTANLGAIKLSKMAGELEVAADNNNFKNVEIKIQQLKQEYQRVLLELEKVKL
ncbi:MAG: PAS domain S-box protein [Methylomarinum sp.]|nr:PAS domain S-box protein [Methylomarinum sp.]